ncbi:MAG: hypothetical protein ACRDZ9_10335 [Acidimicrobiales bacterium]
MRLGLVWFVVVVGAAVTDTALLAAVMAATAALAAGQTVRLWAGQSPSPARGLALTLCDPRRLPAALGAASLPLAAAVGVGTLTGALPIVAVVALVYRLSIPGPGGFADAAVTVAAAVSFGLAAAAPVLVAGIDPVVTVALLVLVCAYDAGDYLVGTGSSTVWEGPVAGITAVVVVTFAVSVAAQPPLGQEGAFALGGVVAALAPMGPPAASLLVGGGTRRAPYVRRLDSLLVLGPIVSYALAALLTQG